MEKNDSLSRSLVMLFLLLFISSLSLTAQTGLDKEILKMEAQQKKAIKKQLKKGTKKDNGLYVLKFTKFFNCPMSGLSREQDRSLHAWEWVNESIMRSNPEILYLGHSSDYIWDTNSSGKVGNKYDYEFYYLPIQDSNNLFSEQTVSLVNMKNEGGGYFYADERYTVFYYIGSRHKTEGEKRFFWFDGLKWSGEVKDGKLEGAGEGYCYKEGKIYFVKGTFHEGRPIGSCVFDRISRDKSLHEVVSVKPFDGSYAMINVKNEYVGKQMCVDKEFNLIDINTILGKVRSNNGRKGRFSDVSFIAFSDDKQIVSGDYEYYDKPFLANGKKLESLKLEYMITKDGKYAGLTENGKEMLSAYLNDVPSAMNNLTKVFNINDISNPVGLLKTKYHYDIQQIVNRLGMVDAITEDIPESKSILQADLFKKIEILKYLCSIYDVINTNYDKNVKDEVQNFDAKFAVGTEGYNAPNRLAPANLVSDKAKETNDILSKLMSNPFFPTKDQATVQKIKSILKAKIDSYSKIQPELYNIAYNMVKDAFGDKERRERQNERYSNSIPKYRVLNEFTREDIKSIKTAVRGWYVKFDDIDQVVSVTYHIERNIDYTWQYYECQGKGPIAIQYKTLDDAIAAAYYYITTGKIRETGKGHISVH